MVDDQKGVKKQIQRVGQKNHMQERAKGAREREESAHHDSSMWLHLLHSPSLCVCV